jgi:hypothetical protein
LEIVQVVQFRKALGKIPDQKRNYSHSALINTWLSREIRFDFDGTVNADAKNAKSEKQR